MKVGTIIADRNCGWSSGLEHPYLYGPIGRHWCVWNRHTGKVCYVTVQRPGEQWDGFPLGRAQKRADQLNAWRIGINSGVLPVDIAAIDSTP